MNPNNLWKINRLMLILFGRNILSVNYLLFTCLINKDQIQKSFNNKPLPWPLEFP